MLFKSLESLFHRKQLLYANDYYTPGMKYIGVYSFCLFCDYVCLSVCLFVNFFPSKITQQLLGLGFLNLVQSLIVMSCIV